MEKLEDGLKGKDTLDVYKGLIHQLLVRPAHMNPGMCHKRSTLRLHFEIYASTASGTFGQLMRSDARTYASVITSSDMPLAKVGLH